MFLKQQNIFINILIASFLINCYIIDNQCIVCIEKFVCYYLFPIVLNGCFFSFFTWSLNVRLLTQNDITNN